MKPSPLKNKKPMQWIKGYRAGSEDSFLVAREKKKKQVAWLKQELLSPAYNFQIYKQVIKKVDQAFADCIDK